MILNLISNGEFCHKDDSFDQLKTAESILGENIKMEMGMVHSGQGLVADYNHYNHLKSGQWLFQFLTIFWGRSRNFIVSPKKPKNASGACKTFFFPSPGA